MGDSDGSDTETTARMTHEDLQDLSLLEIQQLRNKLGIKKFNKKYGRQQAVSHSASTRMSKKVKKTGPMEISSKRPKNATSSLPKKTITRDPRFDDLSGQYDEQTFKRSYKFVDRLKAKELKAIKKIAEDDEMDQETRKKAKNMLTRMSQKKSAEKETSAATKVEQALKEERNKAIKEGHKPFFLKAAEKNKLVLAEKYKELKEKGQLDAFMKRKRKSNAKKDAGLIPKETKR